MLVIQLFHFFFVVNDHSFCADSSRLNGFSLNETHKWTTLFQPHLKSRRIAVWEQRVLSLLSRHTKEYVPCIILKPRMVHRVQRKEARASKIQEIELNNNSFSRSFFLPFSDCKVFEGRWVSEFCLLASSWHRVCLIHNFPCKVFSDRRVTRANTKMFFL